MHLEDEIYDEDVEDVLEREHHAVEHCLQLRDAADGLEWTQHAQHSQRLERGQRVLRTHRRGGGGGRDARRRRVHVVRSGSHRPRKSRRARLSRRLRLGRGWARSRARLLLLLCLRVAIRTRANETLNEIKKSSTSSTSEYARPVRVQYLQKCKSIRLQVKQCDVSKQMVGLELFMYSTGIGYHRDP